MPPAEREQSALCLAQRLGKRVYAHAQSDEIVIGIHYQRDEAQVNDRDIHLDELLYLLFGKRGITVQRCITLVDKLEQLCAITFYQL